MLLAARALRCLVAGAILASAGLVFSAQDDATRSIVAESFLKARPTSTSRAPARPAYRPVGRARPAAGTADPAESVELGVTVWRLRTARRGDTARLLIQEADATSEWTPERVSAGTRLSAGDRVRLGLESARAGYLYVIDREQYGDGATGEPQLIFPTTRTRGGDNGVTGGRLIEIPAQDDRPPYFTMRPSRPDQTGERLTFVVTERPLKNVAIGDRPVPLDREVVADLERRGAGSIEQLELVGGVGRAWSPTEQRAGADATRLLTQDDPPPQTLFRVLVRRADLVAVSIVLTQARRSAPPR